MWNAKLGLVMISDWWVKIVFNEFGKQSTKKNLLTLSGLWRNPVHKLPTVKKKILGLTVLRKFLDPKISKQVLRIDAEQRLRGSPLVHQAGDVLTWSKHKDWRYIACPPPLATHMCPREFIQLSSIEFWCSCSLQPWNKRHCEVWRGAGVQKIGKGQILAVAALPWDLLSLLSFLS